MRMKTGVKGKHEHYRKLLQKKSDELRRNMSAQRVSQAVRRQDTPSDEADLSQQSHEEWIFLNRNTLEMKLLRDVQEALHRVELGHYGICHRCEEPISPKRLDAVPWAKFCVTCQEAIAERAAAGLEFEDDYQETSR